MNDPTRRHALLTSGTLGLLAAALPPAAPADEPAPKPAPEAEGRDRRAVKAAGLTDAEADCWALAAELAGKFFALPELHPMDKQEIATALHVIQHRLLSRPTYRKYLESHKEMSKREG